MNLPGAGIFLVFAVGSAVVAGAPSTDVNLPPAETFGRLPAIQRILVSPGGSHLAALEWREGQPYLAMYDLSKGLGSPPKRMHLDVGKKIEERVDQLHWLNDDTVGVVIAYEAIRSHVPTLETRLFAIKRDLSVGRLIPEPRTDVPYNPQYQHRIIDYLREDPDQILMALDRSGYGTELGVFRVHIDTGQVDEVLSGGKDVADWSVDQQGRVRLRHEIRELHERIRVRNLKTGKWELLDKAERGERGALRVLAFAENPEILYVLLSNDDGFDQLHEFDLRTGLPGRVVLAFPFRDVLGIETDPYTRKVIGAYHAEHHRLTHYFDENLADVQSSIDRALPDTNNIIESFDRERSRFVILATGPKHPGTYYLYEASDSRLREIRNRYPGVLAPDRLVDVEATSYTARDGQVIPAYLTRPRGEPPYPMVLLPHGGPSVRDYLAYDYLAQFLASRGYLVLQPNYRGSTGYGAAFETAGYGQWGLLMQDDLTDGTRAMITRGLADPERICIVGWSYGGYAALMGAIKTPKLFRCAVSGAGVTDLPKMLSERARYKFFDKNQPSVGSFKADREKLRDNSPINNVDAVRIPILLVHGDQDLVVPISHSKRMASKLKKARKQYEFVVLEDGNHHLESESNRIRFLQEIDRFLARYLAKTASGVSRD
jgi:dipeptidyl aminopeptidase/acylaminoacyl peptidase